MPRLDEVLAYQDTLEDNLKMRMDDSINRINTQTTSRQNINRLDTVSTVRTKPTRQDEVEKSTYDGIGSNLWDFTREAGESFVDMTTFGIFSATTDWDPGGDVDTFAEKAGQAVGGALGFLIPFAGTKFAVSSAAKGIANLTMKGAGGGTIAKTISGITKTVAKKPGNLNLADDASEVLTKSKDLNKVFDDLIDTTLVGERFGSPGMIKAFNNLKPDVKTEFGEKLAKNAGELIRQIAGRKGLTLTDEAVAEITEKVGQAWLRSGGRPVNSLQGLLARATGDGKLMNFYTHLFEEGVVFAGVETGMHAVQYAAGKEDAHFGRVAWDAFKLGHAFGLVRFIPGGIEGGLGLNPIRENGRNRLKFLFTNLKAYGSKYNPAKQKDRESVSFMYSQYSKMKTRDATGSDVADDILTWASKKGWDKRITLKGESKELLDHNIHNILKNGTDAEKELVTRYMQDALQYVASSAQSTWRKEFVKALGKDLLTSSGRMAAGGAVMTGPDVLFDKNIPFEDKMIHFTLGAFLLKQGKVLSYKNMDGSYHRYSGMYNWSEPILKTKLTLDTLGTDIYTKEGNIDPLWLTVHLKAAANHYDSSNNSIQSFSNPESIQGMIDTALLKVPLEGEQATKVREKMAKKLKREVLATKKEGEKLTEKDIEKIYERIDTHMQNYVFLADINSPIVLNEQPSQLDKVQRLDVKDIEHRKEKARRKIATERTEAEDIVSIRPDVDAVVFEAWAKSMSKNEILGDNLRFKEWAELTPNQKLLWKKHMDKLKIPTRVQELGLHKLESLFVEANLTRFQEAVKGYENTAREAALAIESGGDKVLEPTLKTRPDGTSYYEFKKINYSNAEVTSEQAAAIREYNALIELIAEGGNHTFAKKEFDVKLIKSGIGYQGIKKFTERINQGISDMNKILDILPKDSDGNPIPDSPQTSFMDTWLIKLTSLNRVHNIITHTSNKLPTYFADKGKLGRTSLGQLLKDVLKQDGYTASYIRIEGSKNNKQLQALEGYINHIRKILAPIAATRSKRNEKTINEVEANNLKAEMLREGFDIFNVRTVLSDWDMRKHVARNVLEYHLRTGKKLIGNKIVDLTQTDIIKIQEGIDAGIINNDLTFNEPIEILFQASRKRGFDEIFNEFEKSGQKKTFDEILEIIKNRDDLGKADRDVLISLIESYKKSNPFFDGVEVLQDLRFIIDTYSPYLRSSNNSAGVIHKGYHDFAMMSPDMITVMRARIHQAKFQTLNTDVRGFLKQIGEASAEEASFNKKLIATIDREIGYSHNPITMMELLSSRGFYNIKKQEINIITETKAQELIKAVRERSRQDWEIIDKQLAIEEQLRDLINKDEHNIFNESNPVRLTKLLNKYPPAEGSIFAKSDYADTQLQHLQGLWDIYKKAAADGKYTSIGEAQYHFMRDFMRSIKDAHKGKVNDADLTAAINKWMNDATVTEKHNLLTLSLADRSRGAYEEGRHKQNPIYTGVKDIQNSVHGITILKGDLLTDTGFSRTLSQEMSQVTDIMFGGGLGLIPKKLSNMEHVKQALELQGHRSVVWIAGVNNNAFVIKYTENNMNRIADNYAKYLQEIVDNKNIAFTKEQRKAILENTDNNGIGKIVYNERTKKYEMELINDHEMANNRIHEIMNDFVIGKALKDTYWNQDLRNSNDKMLGALVKRLPLFGNVNSTNLSADKLSASARFLKDSTLSMENKKGVVKFLDDFSQGKVKEVVFADENVDGQSINNIFSVKRMVKEGFEQARTEIQENQHLDVGVKTNMLKNLKAEEALFDNTVDSSSFNGVTFVRPEGFGALSYLGGNTRHTSAGGVKPIVVGYHKGQVFVLKTAMIKNKQMDAFWKKNKDVGFVSFTSASKKIGGEYHSDYKIIDGSKWNNGDYTVGGDFKRVMAPESINLISVKGDKAYATLGRNASAHIYDPVARKHYFNKYHQEGMDTLFKRLKKLKGLQNDSHIKAEFRRLMQEKVDDTSGEFDIERSTMGVYASWAEAGGMPHLFSRQWANLLFNKYVKKEINKKINGAQGVMAPDFMGKLKNTIVIEDRVFTFGEVEIGFKNRDKLVDKNNITLVKRNSGDYDELINMYDSGKYYKDIESFMNEFAKGEQTLGNLFNSLKKIKDNAKEGDAILDYEIAVSAERFPHTKPSSIMPVVLKGFRDVSEGNVVVLNNADVKRAAEGDYDIDTSNIMWETPLSVMKEYSKGRAMVQDSNPLPKAGAIMSYNNKSFKNREDMLEFSNHAQQAEALRGTLMNFQSIVQHLDSFAGLHGFEYKTPDGKIVKEKFVVEIESGVYLTLNPNLKGVHQKIADYIQATLDSNSGFDTSRINYRSVENEILYGAEDGMFVLKKLSDVAHPETGSKYLRDISTSDRDFHKIDLANHAKVKDIMKYVIAPYRRLLNSATKVYDNGLEKTIGYTDLTSEIFSYDKAMKNAEFDVRNEHSFIKKKPDSVFHGWNDSAKIVNSEERGPIYNRLLTEVLRNGKDLQLQVNDTYRQETVRGEKINALYIEVVSHGIDSSEATKTFNQMVKNQFEVANNLEYIDSQIESIYKLRSKVDRNQYYGSQDVKYYNKKVKKLQEIRDKLKNKLSKDFLKTDDKTKKLINPVAIKMLKRWEDKLIREELKDRKKKKEFEPLNDKDYKRIKEQAKKQLEKNGILIEGAAKGDVLNALVLQDMFGTFSMEFVRDLGMDITVANRLDADIKQLRSDFNKQITDMSEKRWKNESWDNVYMDYVERISNLVESHGGSEGLSNIILSRIMTPNMDITKLVSHKGKLYAKPEYKRMDSFLMLGMKYWQARYEAVDPLGGRALYMQQLTKLANIHHKSLKRLYGQYVDTNGENFTRQDFYMEPLHYNGMKKDLLLQAFKPDYQYSLKAGYTPNRSRLDMYQQLHKAFGTGMMRDIIRDDSIFTLPHSTIVTIDGHSSRISLDGVAGFQTVFNQGIRSLAVSKDGETYLNTPEGNLNTDGSHRSDGIDIGHRKPGKNKVLEAEEQYMQDWMNCM